MTDIEIAQSTPIRPISEVAESIGISTDELEFYGKYKAKLDARTIRAQENIRPR